MKRINLIIIEDSADDTLLILNELKKGGYDRSHFRLETEQALEEIIREGKWDLVISDHVLDSQRSNNNLGRAAQCAYL